MTTTDSPEVTLRVRLVSALAVAHQDLMQAQGAADPPYVDTSEAVAEARGRVAGLKEALAILTELFGRS